MDTESRETRNSDSKKCPFCGANAPVESIFCLKCGRELSVAAGIKKPWLLRNLPWLLAIVLVALVGLTQGLFLTKGNETQFGVSVVLMFLGFIVWIVGLIGFLIQLIRRKKKWVWGNIAFCAFAIMVAGTSMGIYVNPTEEEPTVSSNDTPPPNVAPVANSPNSPTPPIGVNTTAPNITVPPIARGPAGNVSANASLPPADLALARQAVPAAGGMIAVNKPGDPLNGLQLTVPAGAYNATTSFVITSFDPDTTKLDFAIASPVIEVENGGGVAAKPMTLKIPVKYSSGDFPTAFYVNDDGSLEPIPTIAIDASSITIEVYHFSMILTAQGQNVRGRELLNLKNGFNTTFEPGYDDWAFCNNSTYISKIGNCAAMSLSALYYFVENSSKNKGQPLFSLYPGKMGSIHEDDRQAWRLVSIIQHEFDIAPGVFLSETLPSVITSNVNGDEVTYKSFQTAMLITGQPQLILMQGKDKKTGKSLDVGHAMVVYGFKDGLYIADPNDPGGIGHKIPYANGKLGPYETDTDPNNKLVGTVYDTFWFAGSGRHYVSWSTLNATWAKINDRDLGNILYPEYNLRAADDQGKNYSGNLNDGDKMTANRSKITITLGSPVSLGMRIYQDFKWATPLDGSNKVSLDLKPGENLIGIYVYGYEGAGNSPLWTDFRWVTINCTAPQVQKWTGSLSGTGIYLGPGSVSYMWQEIDYSFNFAVSITAEPPPQTAYGSSQGTASVTGIASVTNAIKSIYAIQDKRVGSVTGGTLTGGNNLQATVYGDMIVLSTPTGGPYLVFGQYNTNTWEGSGNLWSQSIYLTIEKRTATQISGHWSFDSRYSTSLPQGTGTILPIKSDGYTFTLNLQP